jgi:hypothetical protein
MLSGKILAAVLALGLLTAGAGVYAYSLLTPSPSSDAEPTSIEASAPEDAPSCTKGSCCH